MSRKKQKQEELMKTHVLNLNEIRETEEKEHKERKRKLPIIFCVMGAVLIVSGIACSIYFKYNEKKQIKSTKNNINQKNQLTCIANLKDDVYKTSIYTKTLYTFKNNKLLNSSIESTVKTESINDNTTLLTIQTNLMTNIDPIYISSQQNINGPIAIAASNNILYINYHNDYTNLNFNNQIAILNNYLKIPSLNSQYKYDDIKKESEKLGSLCN